MNFKCCIVEKYEIVYGKGYFQNERKSLRIYLKNYKLIILSQVILL